MKKPEPGFLARGGLWVVAQLPILFFAFMIPLWQQSPADAWQLPLQVAGALLAVLGILFFISGGWYLGDALTPYPRPLQEAKLCRHGIYRLVRHPIYAGLIFAALGWALWWSSPAGVLYFCMVGFFFDRKAAFEERWMRRTYEDYAAYQKTVKKFIPWVY
jgi:protein-S-isoprenylcysteine O-methyltransferase Ste14